MQRLATFRRAGRVSVMGVLGLAMFLVPAGKAQTNFASAQPLYGDSGAVVVDNTGVVPDANAPSIAGIAPQHTVWFQWSTTNNGVAEFDTIGSVDDLTGVSRLDTVLGVYSGNSLATLNLVSANDDLYPNFQFNESQQNIYSVGDTNYLLSTNAPTIRSQNVFAAINQPYSGPSALRFNVVANTTYYIAVDTKVLTGNIALNWSLHPSGVLRFATENGDLTGLTYPDNTTPLLLYQAAATESQPISSSTGEPARFRYFNDANGVLVTVTRVAGSTGRITVDYTTADIDTNLVNLTAMFNPAYTNLTLLGTNGFLVNGDLPAVAGTDYIPTTGTLTFDDYEMSKTVLIPLTTSFQSFMARPNRDFVLLLTNALVDPSESLAVPPPRVDSTFGMALVKILDVNADPLGPESFLVTNYPAGNSNSVVIYTTRSTNAVFNFEKANYRVYRAGSNEVFSLSVNRTGTNTAASPTVYYSVNSFFPFAKDIAINDNYLFPLTPGSDYATPDPQNSGGVFGTVPDYSFPGGYTGTLSWGDKDFRPKSIKFTIYANGLQQFNEDFQINLYTLDSGGNPHPVGMVNSCTVTIINANELDNSGGTNSINPPAGAVDELYNPDFGADFWLNTTPPQMAHPGTDGQVYGLALQPDGNTVVVGDFFSYDQTAQNCIARATSSGFLDPTFDPGSGADSFITSIALTTNNEIVIGGNFYSYNGTLRNGIALVNTNGALDSGFNPGQGFNNTVYAVALQPNGQILVGGDFTQFNGYTRSYLARLNADGSLDTTFDTGANLNGGVSVIALQANGQVVVGGAFTSVGGVSGQNYLARFNADGSLDTTFNPGSGPDGPVYALGIQPDGNIVLGGNFAHLNGSALNGIARLDPTGQLDPAFYCGTGADGPVYTINIQTNAIFSTTNSSVVVQTNFTIYVGGEFTSYNGTHRLGFARLNADGTLDTSFLDTAYNQFAGLTRQYYGDPVGSVLAFALQPDGDVLIGGSFNQVGGGQYDAQVRPDSYIGAYAPTDYRSSVRNHSNFARLHGGATPGPGNVGLTASSYSVNKSAASKFVSLTRTNGYLGPASVNFAVISGLAQKGVDFLYDGDYNGTSPLYWILWQYAGPTRMHSDGFWGQNLVPTDNVIGDLWSGVNYAYVNLTITGNTNSYNDLTAQFQLSNPVEDQFYLGGQNMPLGVALGQTAAPLKLIEDRHQSGTFSFAAASFTGTNASAPITITRTNGTYGQVTVTYATTTNGSTAVAGADYRAIANGSLTFQATDPSKTFNVTILNSNYVSSVEKMVNLLIKGINPPVNGIASIGVSNTVLRILNPNFQGYLNLSTNAYSANLSSGFVTITVNRSVGSLGTLTLKCATTNGTATNGIDYVGFTNVLSWNNGDVAPKTIRVPLLNSGQIGGSKQFGVVIYNPTNGVTLTPSLFAAGGTTNASVTLINDNSYGTFQFSAPTYLANENGGYSTVTVFRNGATNGTAAINFATADATAFAGTNYVATNGTLNFAPGQLAASFNVAILNDGVVNPPPNAFYFTLALSNATPGTLLGIPALATNFIVDAQSYNRPPGSIDTAFTSGSGFNSDVLALTIQSTGKLVAGGAFTTVNGTPENYLARLNTDGSLDNASFLAGMASANGTIYSLANQTDDKTIAGGAFTSFNGIVRNRIVRLNTDGSLDSSFNPGAGADNLVYSVAEAFVGGVRKIYLGGVFSAVNGISRPNLARLNDNGTVDSTFAAGTGPNAAVYAVAPYSTNSLFTGKLIVGGVFTNINSFTVAGVARLNVDGSVDTNFDAALSVNGAVRAVAIQSDDRVLIGGDFTSVDGIAANHIARLNSDGSLDTTFVAGVGSGFNGTVNSISIQLDGRIVVVGQFSQVSGETRNGITRLLPSGAPDPTINFGDGANGSVNAVLVQPSDQMIVIGGGFTQYNEQPAARIARIYGGSVTGSGAFEFTAAGYQVHERGAQALISIRRTGGTSGPNPDGSGNVTVNFATSDGSAINGINYSGVNVAVSFPPGEVLKTVPVPVLDDQTITTNLTVNLQLSNPTPPTVLGSQPVAVLTIINDDGAVSFSSGNYSVSKATLTGFGLLDVKRIGSITGTNSVDFMTTTNGTAVIGTDYYPTNGTIAFGPGDTDKIIYVPVINNGLPEGNRTVTLSLSNSVGALLYAPSNAVLTIVDSVPAPGQLSFSATNYTASSGDGNAIITVVRTNGFSGSVSVAYATVQGSALPGVNYTTVNGVVAFNDGETVKSFLVPIVNNAVAQPPSSLTVVLSNPGGNATLIAPTNALLTIINTNNGYAFVNATNYFRENLGTAPVFVQRLGGPGNAGSVNYLTVDGTAKAGVNYTPVAGTLNFAVGETLKSISLPLIYDPQVTGDLNLTMKLTSPSSGTVLANPSNSVVVVQDADAGLSFTNSAISVYKNAGNAVITVVCGNPSAEPPVSNTNLPPLTVNFATANGTALAGIDYQATNGTLYFTNGVGTNTFTVPILNNSLVTGDHSFTVNLLNPTAPGKLVAPSSQVVTIIDNNSGLSFSSPVYTILKNGVSTNITVMRTDFTNVTSSVNFATADGTAVAGVDYIATNGVLIFTNGETSKIFTLTVIANTTVQPDKTVLMQLLNPTNGFLIAPYAATLTIHDTSGSLVVPAGSTFAAGGDPNTNGLVDPGETVTMLLALRASGGTNVNNLSATLLATNGVTPSSGTPQSYGTLVVNGASVFRPFTFTASGTNSQSVTATLLLNNGVTNLGTAGFSYRLGSWTNMFYNTNGIIINDYAIASPYPSAIVVSNLGGVILNTVVTLTNLTHGYTPDIQALVVSPGGQDTLLMANEGNGSVSKITLTFADKATNSLSNTNLLKSGTYRPNSINAITPFP